MTSVSSIKDRGHCPGSAPKGTYLIVTTFYRGKNIVVGKLGQIHFQKGHYVYVGSAFGPGGLNARLRHHTGVKARKHWHMDYLNLPARQIHVSAQDKQLEHEWAYALLQNADGSIPGFGCSDCACFSHLFYFKSLKTWKTALKRLSAQYQTRPWPRPLWAPQ